MFKVEVLDGGVGGYGAILALGEELTEDRFFETEKEAEKYAANVNYKMDEAIQDAGLELNPESPYCSYFKVLEPKKAYMHIATGFVDIGSEWNDELTFRCNLKSLIEVELIDGQWREVKNEG